VMVSETITLGLNRAAKRHRGGTHFIQALRMGETSLVNSKGKERTCYDSNANKEVKNRLQRSVMPGTYGEIIHSRSQMVSENAIWIKTKKQKGGSARIGNVYELIQGKRKGLNKR